MSYTSPILQGISTDEFVDVEFHREASSDLLGCVQPDMERVRKDRMFSRQYSGKVYTREKLKEIIKRKDEADAWQYRHIRRVQKQREGQCVYAALSYAMECRWMQQFGLAVPIPLSANSGYINNSRSPNSGSYVGGAIKWSETVGLLPSKSWQPNIDRMNNGDFGCVFGETGNYSERFPDNWRETAKLFRAQEWEWVSTVEEWWSAIANGDVCEGGRDSHAICTAGLALDGDEIYDVYWQTWGSWGYTFETSFGPMTTFGLDSERKVRTKVSRDGFRLRTMRAPDFMDV